MARTKQTARKSTGGLWPFKEKSVIEKAWAIAEIAENILLHLPMKDVLLAQRVCRGWREVIRSSPALQEHLFMRAKPRKDSSEIPIRELNPLLIEHMSMWFSAVGKSQPVQGVSWATVQDVPWANTDARLAFLRRDASWRNMLLAQPPFTIFEWGKSVHVYGGDSLKVGSVEQPDGVRMSYVYDAAVNSTRNNGRFYTLMDGKVDYDAQDPNMEDGSDKRERFFGGIDKFTLRTSYSLGCTGPSFEEEERMLLEQQKLTSAGFDSEHPALKMDFKDVDRSGRYGWWTADGYDKSSEDWNGFSWEEAQELSA